jgi:glycosyltransferase involved in cell wall biosynthesis
MRVIFRDNHSGFGYDRAASRHPQRLAVENQRSEMTRKRILFVEQNHDGTVGGSHTALLLLVRHLDPQQFDVVVAFYENHALVDDFKKIARVVIFPVANPIRIARADTSERRDPLTLAALAIRKAANLTTAFIAAAGRVLRVAVMIRPDVIHMNNTVITGAEWPIAAKLCRARLVVHQRGNVKTPWYASYFDRVVCISRSIHSQFVAGVGPSLQSRAVQIYDAVDVDAIRSRSSPSAALKVREEFSVAHDELLLGIVGNIKDWKGQDVLIRALPMLPESIRWKCLVVGSVSNHPASIAYARALERLACELGVANRVRFTGYRQDVPALVEAMDLLVHTSLMPEPLGLVILEGMAFAKPVVCSAHGGPVEIVEDGRSGFLVPPGDPRALAACLGQLMASPEVRKRMGEAALVRARSFPVADHVSQVQRVYQSFWPKWVSYASILTSVLETAAMCV